jgi:hypothetical protein
MTTDGPNWLELSAMNIWHVRIALTLHDHKSSIFVDEASE